MPKLLLFGAFHRTSIDRDDNTISLFSMIENIQAIRPAEGVPFPGLAPLAWVSVGVWLREPEDEGKEFQERRSVRTPLGDESAKSNVTFDFKPGIRTQRTRVNGDAFPIGGEGEHHVLVTLRERPKAGGDWSEWKVIGDYPVSVTITAAPEAESLQPTQVKQRSSAKRVAAVKST